MRGIFAASVALAMVLSACGSSSNDPVVQVGDRIIDEETFYGAFVAREGPDFEFTGTLPDDDSRRWALFVLDALAAQQALEENGVDTVEARRETNEILDRAVTDGRMIQLDEDSEEWQLILDVVSLSQVVVAEDEREPIDARYFELREAAELADWIGTFNPETGEIDPPN